MNGNLKAKRETESVTMGSAYASTLLELMKESPMVMEIEADLGRSLLGADMAELLKRDYPRQYVDCGVQEANMMSVAAGLSAMKRIPFIHTFAAFASRRIADQAFLSGCYAGANVRIVGSDPGIAAQYNGGTHMPFEDISIYRAYPEMTILDPADTTALKAVMRKTAEKYGMYYIRLFRKNAVKIYEENEEFQIGKAKLLRNGKDVTIIASGAVMIPEALDAADQLAEEGIEARVLDMFTVKPLDCEAVRAAAEETGAIVTAENHNVYNGLGSAVADVLVSDCYAPLEKVGVQDRFGEVGPMSYLKETLHLTAKDIADAAKRAIARKENR